MIELPGEVQLFLLIIAAVIVFGTLITLGHCGCLPGNW